MSEVYRKPVEGYVNPAKRERAIKELKDEYKVKEAEAKAQGLKIPPFTVNETKVKELYLKFGGYYVPTAAEAKAEEARAKAEAEATAQAKAEAEAKAEEEKKEKMRADILAELAAKGEVGTEEVARRGRPRKEVTE